jgi:hypothetical protein
MGRNFFTSALQMPESCGLSLLCVSGCASGSWSAVEQSGRVLQTVLSRISLPVIQESVRGMHRLGEEGTSHGGDDRHSLTLVNGTVVIIRWKYKEASPLSCPLERLEV